MPSVLLKLVAAAVLVCGLQFQCNANVEHPGISGFEEYLYNITSDSNAHGTEQQPANERSAAAFGSRQPEDGSGSSSTTPSSDELLNYFRTIPRDHWSCCMLGLLAGNKGFHCSSIFYDPTTSTRNYNRPHTARHPGMHGRERQQVGHWGYEIMRSFRRCFDPAAISSSPASAPSEDTSARGSARSSSDGGDVSADDDEFHRCCYAATEERRQLKRAQRYRARHQSPRQDGRRRR